MKSIVQQHCPSPGSRRVQGTETNVLGYDNEVQGPRNPLSSSWKWLALKVNVRSLGFDWGANANRWRDYSYVINSWRWWILLLQGIQEYDSSSAELSSSWMTLYSSISKEQCHKVSQHPKSSISAIRTEWSTGAKAEPITVYRLNANRYLKYSRIKEW